MAQSRVVVHNDDETGDVIVGEAQAPELPVQAEGHAANLAVTVDPGQLHEIGAYIREKAENDKRSRASWEDINARGMELLGIGPRSEPTSTDYEDADTSDHPLLLSALLGFQATALSEMLPPERMCVGKPAYDLARVPRELREKVERQVEAAIDRVEAFYLDYLGEVLPSYESDTDLILRDCGLHGLGVRKVYVDPTIRHAPVRADYVLLEDLIIAYNAKSTREGRVTHRLKLTTSDMVRYMTRGVYRVTDLATGAQPERDKIADQRDILQGLTDSHLQTREITELYETHANLFLKDDLHPAGLARPYVVTIEPGSGAVLAIRRNWGMNDVEEKRIEHFVVYPYHPGKSAIFTLGLSAILSNQTEALRDIQRAGVDAGYLANHPAGFKKSNMSIRNDNTRVRPGEFVDVDSPGAAPIRDSLMLHPFKGPDPGLMSLMEHMEKNGKELGGVATADLSSMMGPSVAPGPALAAFDEHTKFQSAVHRRLYKAHKTELRLIHQRMREVFGNKRLAYGTNNSLDPQDLLLVDLLPAMDPAQISRARRMIEAQAKLDTAEKYPDVMNRRAAVLDFLNAIGTDDVEHLLIPEQQDARPTDPVTEFGNALKGMPLAVGPAQNHGAHIDAHVANMKGAQASQLSTDDGARVLQILAAHVAEHYAMDLAVQVAAALGIPMADFAKGIPPDIEVQISPMVAQAVQAIEQLRAEPSDADVSLQIEQIRAQNRIEVERIKQEAVLAREAIQSRQNTEDNETATLNNREDNATALLIAGLKGMAVPATNQPVTAPSNDQRPDPSRSARS